MVGGQDDLTNMTWENTATSKENKKYFKENQKTVFRLLREQTLQPQVWFLESSKKYYNESLASLAEFLNADKAGLYLVDNTTMASNLILKSVTLPPGAEILLSSHIYKTIKNISTELNQLHGMQRKIIHIPRNIHNKEEILRLYEEQFSTNPNINMALIDYITSPSSIVMPVKEIIALCKRYHVTSFVDGSQTTGHIPVNLKRLDPDYFVGSLHKWAFSSISGGYLWVTSKYRGSIRQLITAYSLFTGQPNFLDIGVRDFSPLFTLPTALKCFKQLGGMIAFHHHANEILPWAEAMLHEALGTTPRNIPKDMKPPMIGLVSLPPLPSHLVKHSNDEIALEMISKYNIHVAGFHDFNDAKWVRFSVHLYNKKEDYIKLKEALLNMFKSRK